MDLLKKVFDVSVSDFFDGDIDEYLAFPTSEIMAKAARKDTTYKKVCDWVTSLAPKIQETVPQKEFEGVRNTIFDVENLITEYILQHGLLTAYSTYLGQPLPGNTQQDLLGAELERIYATKEYQKHKKIMDQSIEHFCQNHPLEVVQHFRHYCSALALQSKLDHVCEFCVSYESSISMLKRYHPDFEPSAVFEEQLNRSLAIYIQKCIALKIVI